MSDSSLLSAISSAGSVNPQTPQMGLVGMSGTPTGMMGMGVNLNDAMINWETGENELDLEQDLEGTFTMPNGVSALLP